MSARNRKSITSSIATHQVLNTVELLENISKYLPPSDLYATIRGVCRWWQKVVDGSLQLQRIMFRKRLGEDPYEHFIQTHEPTSRFTMVPGDRWESEEEPNRLGAKFAPILKPFCLTWTDLPALNDLALSSYGFSTEQLSSINHCLASISIHLAPCGLICSWPILRPNAFTFTHTTPGALWVN